MPEPVAAPEPSAPPARRRRRLADVLRGRTLDDVELGTGVWRRLADRFRRAVDRYHQVIEPVGSGALRDDLERGGARLAECLDLVRSACVAAQAKHPSSGLLIPGGEARELHARLSRAATLAAQAAEAAAMARVRAGAGEGAVPDGASAGSASVDRAIAQVEALVISRAG